MQNLALLKFHLLVTTVINQIINFLVQNVSRLHLLSHLSPPAPPTSKGVEMAGISDYAPINVMPVGGGGEEQGMGWGFDCLCWPCGWAFD